MNIKRPLILNIYHVCCRLIPLLLYGMTIPIDAGYKSTTGRISFDTNKDGSPEMIIDNEGITIHNTINRGIQTVSSNVTLSTNSLILADTSESTLTLTLPYAGNVSGRTYTIKKTKQDNSLYLTVSDNYIDDARIINVGDLTSGWYPSIDVVSDGINWHILEISSSWSTVGSANLLAWFPLNVASGSTVSDISKNALILNLNGNANITSGNSAVGKGAVSLDGSGDYLVTSGFSNAYTSFSVTLFAYHTTLNYINDIISRKDGAGAGRTLLYEGDGVITSYVNGVAFASTYTPVAGQWIHYALVYDNGTFKIYADGSEILSFVQTEEGASGEFVFGSHKNNGSNYFHGSLDEIRIYNKALSLNEVQALADMKK